jgi:hypothetical protein
MNPVQNVPHVPDVPGTFSGTSAHTNPNVPDVPRLLKKAGTCGTFGVRGTARHVRRVSAAPAYARAVDALLLVDARRRCVARGWRALVTCEVERAASASTILHATPMSTWVRAGLQQLASGRGRCLARADCYSSAASRQRACNTRPPSLRTHDKRSHVYTSALHGAFYSRNATLVAKLSKSASARFLAKKSVETLRISHAHECKRVRTCILPGRAGGARLCQRAASRCRPTYRTPLRCACEALRATSARRRRADARISHQPAADSCGSS